ncbi:uncharacterized protein LOC130662916 [Microplitis mediator]|uniref:uncharacterized protein LOC130662916 n=1 Tax=Microplitis mediator TaxID=375433 RepID=UPI0025577FF0|nr:uncharacterized protein LOC130662916 [Microplitis mediator]
MILRMIDTKLLVLFSTLVILSINQRVFVETSDVKQAPGTNNPATSQEKPKDTNQAPGTKPPTSTEKPEGTTQASGTKPPTSSEKSDDTTQASGTNPPTSQKKSEDTTTKEPEEVLLGTRSPDDSNAQRISFAGTMDPKDDHYNSASSHSSQLLTILLISAVTTYFVLL